MTALGILVIKLRRQEAHRASRNFADAAKNGEELHPKEEELMKETRVYCICPGERLNFYPSFLGPLLILFNKTQKLCVIRTLLLKEWVWEQQQPPL